MGAVFAPTRFSLVRISIRDLVADGISLVRSSGVGGGGENWLLKLGTRQEERLSLSLWPQGIGQGCPKDPAILKRYG